MGNHKNKILIKGAETNFTKTFFVKHAPIIFVLFTTSKNQFLLSFSFLPLHTMKVNGVQCCFGQHSCLVLLKTKSQFKDNFESTLKEWRGYKRLQCLILRYN